jgi:hypothetical protein
MDTGVNGECTSPTWLNLKLSVALAIACVGCAALLKDYLRLHKEHHQAWKNIYALRRDVQTAKEARHKAEQRRNKAETCAQVRELQLELEKTKLQARLDVLAAEFDEDEGAEDMSEEGDGAAEVDAEDGADGEGSGLPRTSRMSTVSDDASPAMDAQLDETSGEQFGDAEPSSPYVEFGKPDDSSRRSSLSGAPPFLAGE